MANQVARAQIFEDIMRERNIAAIAERRRIEAIESWNDPENVECRRRQAHRSGHLSRASIEARERERNLALQRIRAEQDQVCTTNTNVPSSPRGTLRKELLENQC